MQLWWRKYGLWMIVCDVDALLALPEEDAARVRAKVTRHAAIRQLLICGFSCERLADVMAFFHADAAVLAEVLKEPRTKPGAALGVEIHHLAVGYVATRQWGGLAGKPFSMYRFVQSLPTALVHEETAWAWLRLLGRVLYDCLPKLEFVEACVRALPHISKDCWTMKSSVGPAVMCWCIANRASRPDLVEPWNTCFPWHHLVDDAVSFKSVEWLLVAKACAAAEAEFDNEVDFPGAVSSRLERQSDSGDWLEGTGVLDCTPIVSPYTLEAMEDALRLIPQCPKATAHFVKKAELNAMRTGMEESSCQSRVECARRTLREAEEMLRKAATAAADARKKLARIREAVGI